MLVSGEIRLFAGDGLKGEIYVPVGPDEKSAAMRALRFSDIVRESAFPFREVEDDIAFSATDDPISRFSRSPYRSASLLFHGFSLF